MSTENTVSISIDPSPLRTFVKAIISEELQPTLYGNDNTLAETINEEVQNSVRIFHRIRDVVNSEILEGNTFKAEVNHAIDMRVEDALENSHKMSRIVARAIDYGELAAGLDHADLANEISYRDLADEIDLDDLADRIKVDEDTVVERVLEEIDYKLLARELITAVMDRAIKTNPNS